MNTKTAMMVGIAALALLGCQASKKTYSNRTRDESVCKGQVSPILVARTFASPEAIDEIIQTMVKCPTEQLAQDRVYFVEDEDPDLHYHLWVQYVYVRPWEHGSEIRIWDNTGGPNTAFANNRSTFTWTRLRDALDRRPAQSWLVYPSDPMGEYASKKFGAPKPGSPELSMK